MPTAHRPRLAPSWICLGLIIGLLAALQLYTFHWGVITPDSVEQYRQALTGHYEDWHPPITAWLWRQWIGSPAGSAGILMMDILLYWLGIGLIALGFLRANQWLPALLAIAMGALPIPFGQMGALLKDPLLTALCLFAAGILLISRDQWTPWRLLAVQALVLASATRFNAIFAVAPIAVGLFPMQWTCRPIRLAASGLTAFVMLTCSSWLINVALLQPERTEPIFSLVNFDLAGIAAQGGGNMYPSMNDSEARQLTAACYSPRLYNPLNSAACGAVEDRLVAYAHHVHRSALAIWTTAILHAPLAYLRHRVTHLDWNWRIRPASVPDDAFYVMSEPNPYGLRFIPNRVTMALLTAARWMAWSPFGRPGYWMIVALALLAIADRFENSRAIRIFAASAIGYGSAYAVVSVAPDLRYNLWTMLAAMIALTLAVAGRKLPGAHKETAGP